MSVTNVTPITRVCYTWCLLAWCLLHVWCLSSTLNPLRLLVHGQCPSLYFFNSIRSYEKAKKKLIRWFLFAPSVPGCSSLMPMMVFSGCCQSKHIMTRKMEHHDTKYPLQQLELGAKQEQHHHLYQHIQKKPRTDLGSVCSATRSEQRWRSAQPVPRYGILQTPTAWPSTAPECRATATGGPPACHTGCCASGPIPRCDPRSGFFASGTKPATETLWATAWRLCSSSNTSIFSSSLHVHALAWCSPSLYAALCPEHSPP